MPRGCSRNATPLSAFPVRTSSDRRHSMSAITFPISNSCRTLWSGFGRHRPVLHVMMMLCQDSETEYICGLGQVSATYGSGAGSDPQFY
ncbi:hypothetical protein T10_5565 [Trichinella papuae]|uniref:Uncharacterized protein n=1 Tax=Trichinella papuae TaxID=268474 RepID=A0A0V1N8S8_9BILA|nr:hypothetical protein T10_5565 [Trichinella papuae]